MLLFFKNKKLDSQLSKEEIRIINNVKIGCEELIKLILSDLSKISKKIC